MMIEHHPTTELLVEYANGALDEASSLAVACHAALCGTCRRQIEALEQVGGELLSDLESAALSDSALEATLARIDMAHEEPPRPVIDAATRSVIPSPLWPYLGESMEMLAWRRVAPALASARIAIDGARHQVALLKIAAGRRVPRHTHRGQELTLVLAGGYSDHSGHFARGDLAIADGDHVHQPMADAGEDCIALAVLEAPVRPVGALGRLLAPFMRG